jgi:phospholipid/cholesterol/gamma-HCH transport system permease protein
MDIERLNTVWDVWWSGFKRWVLGMWLGLRRGWAVLFTTIELLVLAVSPACHTAQRRAWWAGHVWRTTGRQLPWFVLMAALMGVVLIQIVLVTASSYGLSHFALEMVVRVLVLELLPMVTALFVVLRCSLPLTAELSEQLLHQDHEATTTKTPMMQSLRWLADEVMPRAWAAVFSVWLLTAISAVLALILAYGLTYGLSLWGLESYSIMVGRVFSLSVTLVFTLKVLAFSIAVGVVPMASLSVQAQWATAQGDTVSWSGLELQGLVRMTGVLLVVELLSLLGNYYS